MALHPERPCGEIYVNTLPPAGHGWDSHRLGSGLLWVLLAIGGHQSPGPRPIYLLSPGGEVAPLGVTAPEDATLVCRVYK